VKSVVSEATRKKMLALNYEEMRRRSESTMTNFVVIAGLRSIVLKTLTVLERSRKKISNNVARSTRVPLRKIELLQNLTFTTPTSRLSHRSLKTFATV
jgi:hypothetical protein